MLAQLGMIVSAGLAALAAATATLVVARGLRPIFVEASQEDRPLLAALRLVVLRRIARRVGPRLPPAYAAFLARRLVQAGEPGGLLPADVAALQVAGAALGASLALLVAAAGAPGVAILLPATAAALPLVWLRDRVKVRLLAITRALPYALDLLTLSVEAGLDFAAGLARVVEKGRPGPLRDELALVLRHLRMGRTREESLRALIERVELPALSSFVRSLIQADRMGTRLGPVMRIQAAQLRQERSMRAEKLAGEAPVKMLFPLLACIFPTVFLVIFGPIVFAFVFGGAG